MFQILLYIDPGSGSMIVQALIAGFLGFSLFFKQLKFKVISFFKGKSLNENK